MPKAYCFVQSTTVGYTTSSIVYIFLFNPAHKIETSIFLSFFLTGEEMECPSKTPVT